MNKLLKVLGTKSAIDNIVADSKLEDYRHEIFGVKLEMKKAVYETEIVDGVEVETDVVITESEPTGMWQLDFNFRGLEADENGNCEIPVNLYGAKPVEGNHNWQTNVVGVDYMKNKIT